MKTNDFFVMKDDVLNVTVEGEFDMGLAGEVQEILDEYKKKKVTRIIFNLKKMSFLASSGLRVFIYAKEQVTPDVEIIMTDAKEIVKRVVNMSGIKTLLKVSE